MIGTLSFQKGAKSIFEEIYLINIYYYIYYFILAIFDPMLNIKHVHNKPRNGRENVNHVQKTAVIT